MLSDFIYPSKLDVPFILHVWTARVSKRKNDWLLDVPFILHVWTAVEEHQLVDVLLDVPFILHVWTAPRRRS